VAGEPAARGHGQPRFRRTIPDWIARETEPDADES
jgi:hypothetical protein